jgi:molybdate transport system substrate-binding protein
MLEGSLRRAILITVLLLCGCAAAQTITVAAAADLNPAISEIAAAYEKQSQTHVKLAFGSSGNLLTQIESGAPFDLFFSADQDYAERAIKDGFAEKNSLYVYAIGTLVLWVPIRSKLDLEHQGLSVLLDPSVQNIAIANPEHAPYGRAAVALLRTRGMYDKVASRLVLGDNVSQAAQFVESGNAQIGLIPRSLATSVGLREKGKYSPLPSTLNQGAVILSRSSQKKEAADFLNYVKSPASATTLTKYGFTIPEAQR